MQTTPVFFPIIDQLFPCLPIKEFPGSQSIVNALKFLSDDSPGPHIEMPHLRRTLISMRKSDRFAGTVQKCPWIFGPVQVIIGCPGRKHGIAFRNFTVSPSVTNDQAYGSHGHSLLSSILFFRKGSSC